MRGGRKAALRHFFRLDEVADFFFVGFFFAGVFFSGEIRNAASGVSLTRGRSFWQGTEMIEPTTHAAVKEAGARDSSDGRITRSMAVAKRYAHILDAITGRGLAKLSALANFAVHQTAFL